MGAKWLGLEDNREGNWPASGSLYVGLKPDPPRHVDRYPHADAGVGCRSVSGKGSRPRRLGVLCDTFALFALSGVFSRTGYANRIERGNDVIHFLLRRLLGAVPVVLGVALAVFLLLHLVPGDPVEMMLGESARAADRTALREALGSVAGNGHNQL